MELIDRILSAGNLTEASREVIRNKEAAGVDHMSVKELKQMQYRIHGRPY